MSRLDSMVVILMLQITILVAAALLFSARRSHPASCRSLGWGAAAALLLTPCAFLPIPAWTSVPTESHITRDATTEAEAASAHEEQPEPSSMAGSKTGPGIDLLRLAKSLRLEPAQLQSRQTSTKDWLTYGIVGRAVLSLLRFGMQWLSLMRTRRRSLALVNGDLLTVLKELCVELGCRRRIELRESSRFGSAAAVGWRRPTILLSTHWRTWTAIECRAILAHEVGHVLRWDFPSRFLARLACAIHGYHPPKPLRALLGSKETMNVYPVDGRTLLVNASETSIKKIIDDQKRNNGKPKWCDQWRQVEHDTFAMVGSVLGS